MVTGLSRGSINIMEQGKDQRWVRFGSWYQKERKDRKKTQEEVSAIADISRQHLSDLENGNTGVKRDTVLRLADAIGVNCDEALQRAGFASTESPTPPGTDQFVLKDGIYYRVDAAGKEAPLTMDEQLAGLQAQLEAQAAQQRQMLAIIRQLRGNSDDSTE